MSTIIGKKYFELVEEVLSDKWDVFEKPLIVKDDDLKAAMVLFGKIAAEAVDTNGSAKESESPSLSASHEVSLETASLSGAVDKIKAFIEGNAFNFIVTCNRSFPFSLLESDSTKLALKNALKDTDSILFHFMRLEASSMSESELDKRFGVPFERLQASEIAQACSEIMKKGYVNHNNVAYYLLWLIKKATGWVYEIPEKSSFDQETVVKVLSGFFAGSDSLKNGANFVEISSKWPIEAGIIRDLFKKISSSDKLVMAKGLASSKNSKISAIGSHFLEALKAGSFREQVPHFNALKELLPNFNSTDVGSIFHCPFIEFCHDPDNSRSISKNDPKFAKRLHFNAKREVVVYESLMIGEYDAIKDDKFDRLRSIPPYLFAYDMNTGKMVWGIPLIASLDEHAQYSLTRTGKFLTLQFLGDNILHFIDPKTGEFDFDFKLPESSRDKYDCLHISPKGFVYQMVNTESDRILIGGKIMDKQWNSSFKTKTPNGKFLPFSTHCGFKDVLKGRLVLFGPTGDQIAIEGCTEAKAEGDKLYSIEKDPVGKDKCLLNIRTLKDDNTVVSGIEKSISLNVKKACFGKICQNGQVILFGGTISDKFPIFVTLDSQEVTYSPHEFSSDEKHLINPDSGEIWIWDEISYEVWKISSAKSTLMGSMKTGRGTDLLHVDKDDRLYFVDIFY